MSEPGDDYAGFMFNDSALYLTGAMALSQSTYISWGRHINADTVVGISQNANGTLVYKDHASGSWTEFGNSLDDSIFGDSDADVFTFVGQLTASEGGYFADKVGIGTTEPKALLEIEQGASGAPGGPAAFLIDNNDTDAMAMLIEASNIDADVINVSANAVTTADVIYISANSMTTGRVIKVEDDSSSTSTRNVVSIDQDNAAAIAATALKVSSYGGITGIDLNKDFSDTTAATVTGLNIDLDKTATTTSNNTIYGVNVDLDNTTATNGTNTMVGVQVTPTLTHAADAGTPTVKGAIITATGGTNGTAVATGMELTSTGADTNNGLIINCADGGTDLKVVSSADTGDYFSVATTANGATTITTVDDGGAAADLTLDVDGDIILDAGGGDVYITGSLNVSGTLKAYQYETIIHDATTYRGSTSFGNDAGDVSTFTSQVTASQGLEIIDNVKLYFGSEQDAHIRYDEQTSDELIISGALGGIDIQLPSAADALTIGYGGAAWMTLSTAGGQNNYTQFNQGVNIIDDTGLYFGSGFDISLEYDEDGTDTLLCDGSAAGVGLTMADDVFLYFGTGLDAKMYYDESSSDELIISGALGGIDIQAPQGVADALTISSNGEAYLTFQTMTGYTLFNKNAACLDDVKLYFGSGADASIEFDNNGTGELRFAGAAATFEQDVTFDNNVTLGIAATDVTTVTSQLTASEGLNIPDNERFSFGTGAQSDMYLQNTGTTGSLSSSIAFRVKMADEIGSEQGADPAFVFEANDQSYLTFHTRNGSEMMFVEKEFNATNDTPITFGSQADFKLKSTGATGSLSSSLPFEVNMADDAGEQDGTHGAFIFKDSGASYMTFLTRAGQEMMFVEKEFNATNDTPITFGSQADFKLKSTGATGSLSSSLPFEVNMADDAGEQDGTHGAFIFKDSGTAYMTFLTRIGEERMFVEKEFSAVNDTPITFGNDPGSGGFKLLSTGTTGSLSSSVAFDIHLVDDSTNAFTIKDSGTTYFNIDTRPGANNTLSIGADDITATTDNFTINGAFKVSTTDAQTTSGLMAMFEGVDGNTDEVNRISINANSANADSGISFLDNSSTKWTVGCDGSTDEFHMRVGYALYGVTDEFVLNSAGKLTLLDDTASSATQGAAIRLVANDGAAMADDHRLGSIEFAGAEDGSNTITVGARIDAICDDGWSASENGAALLFYTTDGNASQSEVLRLDSDKLATFSGHVNPGSDNSLNLGSAAYRWANVYTADLHLKNDRGDWTIVEEEDYICVVNNKTNKRYKMMLEEVED